jgi:mitochondrial fission protein ELM1
VSDPSIWVLLGERTGDNNQALALADALGLPFEAKQLDYNALQSLSVWLPPTALTLTGTARQGLAPPWPDLVIAIGRRSVPVARWIKRQSGGRTKLVRIGHPRIDPGLFDLVITTRQYPVPPRANVVLLPVAMSRHLEAPEPTAAERAWLDAVPPPRRLIAIGGATKYWRLPSERIEQLAAGDQSGHSLVLATSRRTDPGLLERLRSIAGNNPDVRLVDGPSPRFAVLMDHADEIFVTGDSISMLSEAVLAGKPVALIPIEQDDKGRRQLGPEPRESGPHAPRRDLRRFWNHLIAEGMIGTVESGPKRAASIPNPNRIAADAVKRLLGFAVDRSAS